MITKVCNLLCWGVPEKAASEMSTFSGKNLPVINYTKADIDKFEKFLKKKKGINFLQRFFNYEKKCKHAELHYENLLFKIALLEHFIACRKFLEDIASLSVNGIRGYLLVDSRIKCKEEVAGLLEFCQKRALFMLEFKPFRNFLKNYPIMREKTLSKKLKVMRKLKKKLKIFNTDFFSFRNNSDATNIILDYRLIFYNKLAKFCIAYFTLICAYCHIARPVHLYEIFNDYREVKNIVERINTKFFMLVSSEAIEKLSPLDIDEDIILAIEQLYHEMGKKAAGEFNEEFVNSLYQKVLDCGLKVVKEYKILSDRHHFSGLESFLLERIAGKARLERLSLSRKMSYSPKKRKRKFKNPPRGMDKHAVVEEMVKSIKNSRESKFRKRRMRFEEKRRQLSNSGVRITDEQGDDEIDYDPEELEEILREGDSEARSESVAFLSTIREVSDYSGTMFAKGSKNSEMRHGRNGEEYGN